MALKDLFRSRKPEPVRLPPSGSGLLTARDRLQTGLLSGQDNNSLILSICAVRAYVFSSILNGQVQGADAIRSALNEVDMMIPRQRLRLATLQIEYPGETIPTLFERLRYIVDHVAGCVNMQRYAHGEPRILGHLTSGQPDEVCLMPLLEDTVPAAYFTDFLQQVNARLRETTGGHFTACISGEFSDLTQLPQIYFHTRQIHELLTDARIDGPVWLAEQEQQRWDSRPETNETVWWVEPMRQYVMQHFDNPELNITFLAREFGISSAYVGRKFREVTGLGLLELIHRCRLRELERRVAGGETIKDAAAAVGYSSLLTMQRARERYSHE